MRITAAAVVVLSFGGLLASLEGSAFAAVSASVAADPVLPAPSGNAEQPKVVALMAAVGDRLTVVRQKRSVGSHLDPFVRAPLRVPGQTLNTAVLRGLDKGIEQEYPDAERVLLTWNPTTEMEQQLDDVKGTGRDNLLVDAVIQHLRTVEARTKWDRIEVIVPKYRSYEANGLGTKLQGIGIYVQPLGRGALDLLDEAMPPGDGEAGTHRVVNPNTGEGVRSSTFVAPYMFFERLSLDARTLTVLQRKTQYDAVKYNDPMSEAIDVGKSIPPELLADKLNQLAERSAFQAIRGKGSSVDVTAPRAVPQPSAPAASAAR